MANKPHLEQVGYTTPEIQISHSNSCLKTSPPQEGKLWEFSSQRLGIEHLFVAFSRE